MLPLVRPLDDNIPISALSCMETLFLIGPHAVHPTFSLVYIIRLIYHFFYHFKIRDCRRKLYTLMIINQLMSKFRVTLTNVKWMKACTQADVNKLLQLLYIQIVSWSHLAIYFRQLCSAGQQISKSGWQVSRST